MTCNFKSIGLVAGALALATLAAPAEAQFGGLLGGARSRSSSNSNSNNSQDDKCSESRRSTGSRVAGGIFGSIASNVVGNPGGVFNYVPVAGLTDQLTASIACRLDPDEQQQAADATLEATRSADGTEEGAPEVGQMSEWSSNTRDDVSGTSTVVASEQAADDGVQCITVTDVVIVNGEEARADKRMCRRPPARYAIVAA